MKTLTQWSRCGWVRKTNLRATEQSEKFYVRRGIHRSLISWVIQTVFQVLQEKACSTADWSAQHACVMFGVWFERQKKFDTKQTYMKTETCKHVNSILKSFEYLCQISWKSIHIISSYTVSKLGRFFATQCSCCWMLCNFNCADWWTAALYWENMSQRGAHFWSSTFHYQQAADFCFVWQVNCLVQLLALSPVHLAYVWFCWRKLEALRCIENSTLQQVTNFSNFSTVTRESHGKILTG